MPHTQDITGLTSMARGNTPSIFQLSFVQRIDPILVTRIRTEYHERVVVLYNTFTSIQVQNPFQCRLLLVRVVQQIGRIQNDPPVLHDTQLFLEPSGIFRQPSFDR